MLVAMINNPMIPETWLAAIDLLLATLDSMTREGRVNQTCRFVEVTYTQGERISLLVDAVVLARLSRPQWEFHRTS